MTKKEEDYNARRAEIATLLFKGNTNADIVQITGLPRAEVARHILNITKVHRTETKGAKAKKEVLKKINLVQKTAWDIVENRTGVLKPKGDSLVLAALRVVTSSQELEAKVQGVTQEKVPGGSEKEASKLLGEILRLEKEAKEAKASPSPEKEETKETPLPKFLEDFDKDIKDA